MKKNNNQDECSVQKLYDLRPSVPKDPGGSNFMCGIFCFYELIVVIRCRRSELSLRTRKVKRPTRSFLPFHERSECILTSQGCSPNVSMDGGKQLIHFFRHHDFESARSSNTYTLM